MSEEKQPVSLSLNYKHSSMVVIRASAAEQAVTGLAWRAEVSPGGQPVIVTTVPTTTVTVTTVPPPTTVIVPVPLHVFMFANG